MKDKLTDIQEVQQVQTDIMLQNEDNADNRHDIGETTADTRCDHISNRVGRTGWNIIAVIIAVTVLTTCFAYNHVSQLNDKINELESTVAMHGDNKALKAQNAAMEKAIRSKEKAIRSKDAQIIELHAAADREAEKNAQYYQHMQERSEGLTDHIMSLNDQLEEADKNAERFKIRNDVKKQMLDIAFAIAANSPPRFKEAVGDDDLPQMRFYPLAVKMAIGLGSLTVLDYIQSVEGWDKTIPKGLADHVKNPEHVPLKRYEQLRVKGKKAQIVLNQLKGRIADQDKTISAHKALIKELKGKIYDEKYLPQYSTQQVMYNSAYHTVAENVRPKDLKKWVGKATPEEWIGYLRMAVARNSNNVYEAIMELDEVTSIPEVKAYIEATDVLANLLR